MVGKPLVEASMTGLNSILMAYGQTGAGRKKFLFSRSVLNLDAAKQARALVSTQTWFLPQANNTYDHP